MGMETVPPAILPPGMRVAGHGRRAARPRCSRGAGGVTCEPAAEAVGAHTGELLDVQRGRRAARPRCSRGAGGVRCEPTAEAVGAQDGEEDAG